MFLTCAGKRNSPALKPANGQGVDIVEEQLIEFLNVPSSFRPGEQSEAMLQRMETSGALCSAAAAGDIPLLRSLVDKGVDANEGDYDKRTAIHLAASEGLLEVVKFLIEEAGANHSPQDRCKQTPPGMLTSALCTRRPSYPDSSSLCHC